MQLSPDRSLQVRIAGTFALIVAANAAVLGVVVWGGLHAWAAVRSAPTPTVALPVLSGALLVGGLALVAIQARYGSRRAVADLDVDGDPPRDLRARVDRLANQAGVQSPDVAVSERSEPCCLTVGPWRSPTIVVTAGLLDALDDDELDAALAHEIAHVANRDLPVATAVAATLGISDGLLQREGRLKVVLGNLAVVAALTGIGVIVFFLPIFVLGTLYLLLSPVARGVLGINAVFVRLFARYREYAADRGAVQLTGDPAALASALRTIDPERPDRDLRLDATATLGIVHRSLDLDPDTDEEAEADWVEKYFDSSVLEAEEDPEPGALQQALSRLYDRTVAVAVARFRRALRWRPATHPETTARIERLRAVERDRRS